MALAARYNPPSSNEGTDGWHSRSCPVGVGPHRECLVIATGHRPMGRQGDFVADLVFDGDRDRNFARDPLITGRELVRPVLLAGEPGGVRALVTFELVLDRR